MDGAVTNEFSSRSNIMEQLLPFVKSFSDCSLNWPDTATLDPIDPCVRKATDPKVRSSDTRKYIPTHTYLHRYIPTCIHAYMDTNTRIHRLYTYIHKYMHI